MTWFLAILGALFIIASFPVDGLPGVLLAVVGVVLSICSIRTNPTWKGRAR